MKLSYDFLFGASTKVYKIEDNALCEEKIEISWDKFSKRPSNGFKNKNIDKELDYYKSSLEEIALIAEMGLETYNFSISLDILFPEVDEEISLEGLDFYNHIIDKCLECGIVPYVTLYHGDFSLTFSKEGGWLNREKSERFINFAITCFKNFGDRVKNFITFNETLGFCDYGYLHEMDSSGIKKNQKKYFQMMHNIIYTHAKVVIEYKKLKLYGEIGISNVFNPCFPPNYNEKIFFKGMQINSINSYFVYDLILLGYYPEDIVNQLSENNALPEWTQDELEIIKQSAQLNDFIGLNYHQSSIVEKSFKQVEKISSEDFLHGLSDIKDRYGQVKLYIIDSGYEDDDPLVDGEVWDVSRINYIKSHLISVKTAISRGINIKGYFVSSAIDLSHFPNNGKRCGFIYVDCENDFIRKRKMSFYWYKSVIESRCENL